MSWTVSIRTCPPHCLQSPHFPRHADVAASVSVAHPPLPARNRRNLLRPLPLWDRRPAAVDNRNGTAAKVHRFGANYRTSLVAIGDKNFLREAATVDADGVLSNSIGRFHVRKTWKSYTSTFASFTHVNIKPVSVTTICFFRNSLVRHTLTYYIWRPLLQFIYYYTRFSVYKKQTNNQRVSISCIQYTNNSCWPSLTTNTYFNRMVLVFGVSSIYRYNYIYKHQK